MPVLKSPVLLVQCVFTTSTVIKSEKLLTRRPLSWNSIAEIMWVLDSQLHVSRSTPTFPCFSALYRAFHVWHSVIIVQAIIADYCENHFAIVWLAAYDFALICLFWSFAAKMISVFTIS